MQGTVVEKISILAVKQIKCNLTRNEKKTLKCEKNKWKLIAHLMGYRVRVIERTKVFTH